MNWDKVKNIIGNTAPLLGGLIGGPAGAGVGTLISHALGVENTPDAIERELVNNPDALLKLKQLEYNNKEKLETLYIEADTQRLKIVNETYQTELKQEDKYVKRARPTFIYALIITWFMTWYAIVYTILTDVAKAPEIITALVGTTALWGIALAVVGVTVHNRSKDKQLLAGFQPKTLIEQIRGK